MPHILLQDPWGMGYQITTRRTETTLLAWFDEILPIVNHSLGEYDVPPARISVHPMFGGPAPKDPDWLCDSRAIGGLYEFPATTGMGGIRALIVLRQKLERVLAGKMPWTEIR